MASETRFATTTCSVLVFLLTFAGKGRGKEFGRCELVRELFQYPEIPKDQIGIWTCIALYESNYNTSAMNPWSGDFGIFQISDMFWCSPPGRGKACGRPCSDFLDDDIRDDLECALKIYEEHERLSGDGFNAWAVYPNYCKNIRAEKFLIGCFNSTEEEKILKTITTEKIVTKSPKSLIISTLKPSKTIKNYEKIKVYEYEDKKGQYDIKMTSNGFQIVKNT